MPRVWFWMAPLLIACGGKTEDKTRTDSGVGGASACGVPFANFGGSASSTGGSASGECPAAAASVSGSYPAGSISASYSVFAHKTGGCGDWLQIIMLNEPVLPGTLSKFWPVPWLQLDIQNVVGDCIPGNLRIYDGANQYDVSASVELTSGYPSPVGGFVAREQGVDVTGSFAPRACSDLDLYCP